MISPIPFCRLVLMNSGEKGLPNHYVCRTTLGWRTLPRELLRWQSISPSKIPSAKIVGLDFSPNMLKRGNKKIHKFHYNNIFLLSGDATTLPFPKNSFDALTIVFGIRNIINRELALKEFYSVLKPQGQLIIMEFGFPEIPLFRSLYLFYFNHLLPWIGNLLVSSDHAYTYLRDSVYKFPAPEQFMETLRSVGFKKIQRLSFTGGIVNLFKAFKE